MESIRNSNNFFINDFTRAEVDSRDCCPCYDAMNGFIDLEQLLRLDDYLTEPVVRHFRDEKDDHLLNLRRLAETTPARPHLRACLSIGGHWFSLRRS